ncbi:MAG: MucR family transcriptional regulator [Kiloniellaceae bacterium]
MTGAMDRAVVDMAAKIVVSYVECNRVPGRKLPALIREVACALQTTAESTEGTGHRARRPAVPISESVTPDYIVCLEDGKRFRTLKRHLRSAFKLSPEEYRRKWGLPHDYPMVAPNYARMRSSLAHRIGLGRPGMARRKHGAIGGKKAA